MDKVRLLDTDGMPYSDEDIAMMHPEIVEELLREQRLGDTTAEMHERSERRVRAPRKRDGGGRKIYRVVIVLEEESNLIRFSCTSSEPEDYVKKIQQGNSRDLVLFAETEKGTHRQMKEALELLDETWEPKQYGNGWYRASDEELEGILARNKSEEIENSSPEDSRPKE